MEQIVRQLGVTKPFVYCCFQNKLESFERLSRCRRMNSLTIRAIDSTTFFLDSGQDSRALQAIFLALAVARASHRRAVNTMRKKPEPLRVVDLVEEVGARCRFLRVPCPSRPAIAWVTTGAVGMRRAERSGRNRRAVRRMR